MTTVFRTRLATPTDAEAIAAIYNEGIADRIATFETEPRTPQQLILTAVRHPASSAPSSATTFMTRTRSALRPGGTLVQNAGEDRAQRHERLGIARRPVRGCNKLAAVRGGAARA